MNVALSENIPEHVPPDRVFDFDLFDREADPRLKQDLHKGLLYLHREAPDVFWTPRNGGHWVVTRADAMARVVKDPEHFSTRRMNLPRSQNESEFIAIPINLDPPAHTPYRHILMRYFSPRPIKAMEGEIRERARALIDAVRNAGECDFVSDIAIPLPVSVFMDMIGWPLERLGEFRAITEEILSGAAEARRQELIQTVLRELTVMIDARKEEPRDDMMSQMLAEEIDGRKLSMEEVLSMCFFLFIAGLDTVANAAGFITRTLAMSPEMQARLAADDTQIADFVEEGLRTSGIVNTLRIIDKDVEFDGVQMRKDDIVIVMLTLAGLDDRLHRDAERFDMDRKSHANLIFGSGVHLCAGHYLAKLELNVLVEEWVKAVPSFRLKTNDNPFRLGSVMALKTLPLAWPGYDAEIETGGEKRVASR